MALFNSEDFDKWQIDFENSLLRREFPRGTDDEYFNVLRERAGADSNPGISSNISDRMAKTLAVSTAYATPIVANQDISPDTESTLVSPEPEYQREAWGSAVADTWRTNKKMNLKSRRSAMFELTKLQSGDVNAVAALQRWLHRSDELLEPAEATMLARNLGSDMKFDKPMSQYYVEQAVYFDNKDKALKNILADNSQIGSLGRWNDATVLAAGMAGGIGPVEATVGLVGGWLIPEIGAAAVARTGRLVQDGLKIKKVKDAAQTVKTLKTLNNISEAAAGGAEARAGIAAALKSVPDIEKAIAGEERALKAAKVLEEIAGIRYENLGIAGKTGLDILATTATDIPFINASRATSEELGLDIYTEQDKMVDSLFAFGLGGFLPAGVRAIGKKMGISPTAMLVKKFDDIDREITVKNALGEISDADAAKAHSAVKELKSGLTDTTSIFKSPDEMQYEMADSLAKINMSQEQAVTYLRYVTDQIAQGNVPKMRELPEFESLMSHIDARVVRQLANKPITEVFSNNILREATKSGLHRVTIKGEDGLLGQRAITGLTPEESIEKLELMYKAFVLDDLDASMHFKEWSDRFSELTAGLEQIQAKDAENIRLNAMAKKVGEKPPVPIGEQVNKRVELQNLYMTYKLGREKYADELSIDTNNRYMEALGDGTSEPHSIEYDEALAGFEDFYNKYTTTNEKGYVAFSNEFSDFVTDMKAAAQDNAFMADIDNTLINIGEEKLKTVIEKMQNLDVSADTTDTLLFGVPRVTFEALRDLTGDVADIDARLALARMEYNTLKNSDATREAFNTLSKYSVVNKDFGSVFDIAVKKIDKIREYRTSNYVELEQGLLDALHKNEELQTRLQGFDVSDPHATRRSMRYLRMTLKSALDRAFIDSPVGTALGRGDAGRIVRNVLDNIMPEIEQNPKMIEGFMNPESLSLINKIDSEALDGKPLEATTQAVISWNLFMEPLRKNLDYALGNIELQELNNIKIGVNKMTLMQTHPAWAAEIVTGAATQTQYGYLGSRRSIEYQSKSVGFYINDLKNTLRKMQTTDGGQNLLVWSRAPENKEAIQEALIRKAHNEPYTANNNAARVADVIANQEASFRVRFRNFGSDHPGMGSPIKRSKLRYADTAVSDTEAREVYDNLSDTLNLDASAILRTIERQSDGSMREGNLWVTNEDKARITIKNVIKEMQETAQELVSMNDETHRKLAVWAFRDFNLDEMFDKEATSFFSLNTIRDALLNGTITELIDGDIQNLRYIASGFKRIKTALIGSELRNVGGTKHASGFVYNFRSGLYNLRAAAQGERSAAVEVLRNTLAFKDADSEILAASKFGYDTLDEYVQRSYDNIFNAYFAMQEFGTNPREMAHMLVDTYNTAVMQDAPFRKRLVEMAVKSGRKDPSKALADKYIITEGAKASVDDNVAYGAGLHNMTPSTPARVIKSIKTFLSAPLLMKAGLKSFSDHSTIFSALLLNGMAQGRGEALEVASKAAVLAAQHPELRDLVLGSTLVEADTLLRKMNNDPTTDIIKMSRDYDAIDRMEDASHKWSNGLMNNMGQMANITNYNKNTATWAISLAIGKKADTPFAELGDKLQFALTKEGFTERDWDFLRTHFVKDFAETVNRELEESRISSKDSFKMLIPQEGLRISDDVWINEMKSRGILNIDANELAKFKDDMFTRVWTMVDAGSDEMVSIPSGRVETWMHMGKARNSGMGIAAEIITQYNSFPAALAYNTYFKWLANFASRETGVSVLDLFNPHVKLNQASRPAIFLGLGGLVFNIATSMLVVDTLVNASAGQIQKPIDKDGRIHADSAVSSLVGSLGTAGTLMNALIEGVEGSGQRGGGFSLQVAPSLSNALRIGYRMSKPLRSEKVSPEDKPEALAAGAIQEVARATGIRSMPFVGLFWQNYFGAALDMQYSGGPQQYRSMQKARERRGYVLMPWEQNPQSLMDRLQ